LDEEYNKYKKEVLLKFKPIFINNNQQFTNNFEKSTLKPSDYGIKNGTKGYIYLENFTSKIKNKK